MAPKKYLKTTAAAVRLLRSRDLAEWNHFEGRYREALEVVSKQRNLQMHLIDADKWVREELPILVNSREKKNMERKELERFLQWKLWRAPGKTTLMPLVKKIKISHARSLSSASFKSAEKGLWKEAINKLSCMPGVGVPMATGILSFLFPDKYVYMADEVIEATTGLKRKYVMKTYEVVKKCIEEKTTELGPDWNMEKVGRVMWTAAKLTPVEEEDRMGALDMMMEDDDDSDDDTDVENDIESSSLKGGP